MSGLFAVGAGRFAAIVRSLPEAAERVESWVAENADAHYLSGFEVRRGGVPVAWISLNGIVWSRYGGRALYAGGFPNLVAVLNGESELEVAA